MKRISLAQKMIGAFFLMGIIVILGGILGPWGITRTGKELKAVRQDLVPVHHHLGILREGQQAARRFAYALVIPENFSDAQEKARLLEGLGRVLTDMDSSRKELEALSLKAGGEASLRMDSFWEKWKSALQKFIQLCKEGKREEALAWLLGQEKEVFEAFGNQLEGSASVLIQRLGGPAAAGKTDVVKGVRRWVLSGTLIGMGLAVFLGVLFSRSVARPIRRILMGLTDSCERFESTARQIAVASDRLASGTSAQAAAVEEASSVTAELSQVIQSNTEEVEKLQVISGESTVVGQEAFEYFRQAKKATKEIKQSSEETSKIVKTIGEIAFQTNLLALSASVEAAQSSEAGIGFSVVAQEVRNLAKRSTEAAKTTTALIEETLRVITKGDDLVRASLGSFIAYGQASAPINGFSVKAAEVAQKQAQGIEQINVSLGEIAHAAQKNAASAQDAAAAARQISTQAAELKKVLHELRAIMGEA